MLGSIGNDEAYLFRRIRCQAQQDGLDNIRQAVMGRGCERGENIRHTPRQGFADRDVFILGQTLQHRKRRARIRDDAGPDARFLILGKEGQHLMRGGGVARQHRTGRGIAFARQAQHILDGTAHETFALLGASLGRGPGVKPDARVSQLGSMEPYSPWPPNLSLPRSVDSAPAPPQGKTSLPKEPAP